MLLSPAEISRKLDELVTTNPEIGPHTALLLIPRGAPLVTSSALEEPDGEYEGEDDTYLEPEERRRLLAGLAAQWDCDESPKMECEVSSRLFTACLA